MQVRAGGSARLFPTARSTLPVFFTAAFAHSRPHGRFYFSEHVPTFDTGLLCALSRSVFWSTS